MFEELVCMTENSVLPTVTATATMQSAAVFYQKKTFNQLLLTAVLIVKAVLEKQ